MRKSKHGYYRKSIRSDMLENRIFCNSKFIYWKGSIDIKEVPAFSGNIDYSFRKYEQLSLFGESDSHFEINTPSYGRKP